MFNTLKTFINYNFLSNEYNTLSWNSTLYDNINSHIKYDNKNSTLDSECYVPIIRFKSIRCELEKYKMSDMKHINYCRMSECRTYQTIELAIDEAIDALCYADINEIPEILLEYIDFSSEDSIIEFVENYYKNIGPIFEDNGNLIIRV